MAKKRKWGGALAFGLVTAALGGYAAYKHRKEIERTLQEIANQMEGWDGGEDFFHDPDTVVHTASPVHEEGEEPPAEPGDEPTEQDFADVAPAQEDAPEA